MGRIRGNQHGFTIVEAIIGMLLASGLAYTVATVVDMSAKAERNASIGAERSELIGILRQILTPAASCTANLKETPVTIASPYPTTSVELFYTKPDPTNPLEAIKDKAVVTDGRFGKIQEVKFSVGVYAQVKDSTWLAKVFIEGKKASTAGGANPSSLGGNEIYGSVSTQVELQGGKIIRCISDQNISLSLAQNDPVMNDKICKISSGGLKLYDPVTNTCKDVSQCYAGTATFAACPAGWSLVSTNYEGHDDPNWFDRPFLNADGTTSLVSVHPTSGVATGDYVNNTVTCTWAVGVITTNAKCEACCRPPL